MRLAVAVLSLFLASCAAAADFPLPPPPKPQYCEMTVDAYQENVLPGLGGNSSAVLSFEEDNLADLMDWYRKRSGPPLPAYPDLGIVYDTGHAFPYRVVLVRRGCVMIAFSVPRKRLTGLLDDLYGYEV